MLCKNCGYKNDQLKKYCSNCGVEMSVETQHQEAPSTPYPNYQQEYQQPAPGPVPSYGAGRLPANFSLLKYILLNLVTFGLYSLYVMYRMAQNINMIATDYDGKTTSGVIKFIVLSWLTLGIYAFVWYHKISNRIGDESRRRGSHTTFSAVSFWLWHVLLAPFLGVFVYLYMMFQELNYITNDYNNKGY